MNQQPNYSPGLPPQPPMPAPVAPQPAPQPQPPAQPMPQPEAPLPRHHVHHSYMWLESIRTCVIVIVMVVIANFSTIAGLMADGELDGLSAGLMLAIVGGGTLVLLLIIVAIVVVTRLVSYKHLYFTVGPSEFTLCSGVFNKKKVHVPYQRVQSVDQRATLLQRIFGVCTVAIDTAGGAANKAVVVPYLTKAQAEWLRAELYNRKAALAAGAVPSAMPGTSVTPAAVAPGAPSAVAGVAAVVNDVAALDPAAIAAAATSPAGNVLDAGAAAWGQFSGVFGGPAQDTGAVSYEYGLTNKELFLAGLSNTTSVGLIALGLIVGVLQAVGFLFDAFGDAANIAVEEAAIYFSSEVTAWMIGGISAVVVGIVLVLWVLSAVGSCISYGGFKARRRGSRIEVEYGLLQHTFQGVAVDRVQSVVVKQSFIRRLFGYCELSLGKIDAADDSDDASKKGSLAQQGLIIHPFVKMSRVPEILAGIVPEFAELPTESRPVARVALRRAIVRRGIIQGGGFWLAVLAVAGFAGMAWFNGALESGMFDLDWQELWISGMLASFGPSVLAILLALALILVIIDIVGAVLWARESSFAFNRRFMQVSNGGFSRETVSFPRQKIQFGCARTNPLQRRAGTDTLLATTAAGSGGTTTVLIDAAHEDAMAWLDWLKPGGNMVK
ncbi:PH domain-containing protein [uncultured Adlercreutzia sp.]|uniref:PH domain-containing protein n=2 Tax=uncultured Adlercreutzia sp. TaxID=875803 RepID=UPI0025E7240E|nr:PH domain-containing protein [uncultured Adlercreutzia sp.]